MASILQSILSYANGMGWRGKILASLGFALATEVVYEVYVVVQKHIGKSKSQKPFCEVRFMNRARVSDSSPDLKDVTLANLSHLISYIDRAQHSICLSMYILTLKEVCVALLRAHNERNVIVRVVCCESMVYNDGSQIRYLDNDCLVRFKVGSTYLMHHKFCLLDADWLCAKCLVAVHIQLDGPPAPPELQVTLFDRAVSDGMDELEKAFGSSCRRCDPSKRMSAPNSVSNPLPEGGCLIVGSSNWTMPGLTAHWDNMIFTSLPEMVRPFAVEFQRQWYELSGNDKNG